MSSQFQNRLVGTIVIVALGVIFLPDILDGKKESQQEQFTEIPLRPAVIQKQTVPDDAFVAVKAPVAVDLSDNSEPETKPQDKAAVEVKAKTEAKVESKPQPKPVIKLSPIPKGAWTLQLGGFNNANNVNALIKQLRGAGYNAYTIPTKPIDGHLTKVFVGPDVSESKLSKWKQEIKKLTKLNGRVVAYRPLD